MEELHEFLGVVGLLSLIATTISGIMIYKYRWIKSFAGKMRPYLKSVHYYGTIGFASLLLLHLLTTNKTHFLLVTGSSLLCFTLVLGFSFKYSKKYFTQIIKTKIILLITAAIFLSTGHDIVDKQDDFEESMHYNRSYDD